jgi:hypothetical protein
MLVSDPLAVMIIPLATSLFGFGSQHAFFRSLSNLKKDATTSMEKTGKNEHMLTVIYTYMINIPHTSTIQALHSLFRTVDDLCHPGFPNPFICSDSPGPTLRSSMTFPTNTSTVTESSGPIRYSTLPILFLLLHAPTMQHHPSSGHFQVPFTSFNLIFALPAGTLLKSKKKPPFSSNPLP